MNILLKIISTVLGVVVSPAIALAADDQGTTLPRPELPFRGKIERLARDSTPDFPKGIEAPKGAPNILLVLTDDVGFGASSTFGGPIATPTFDRVAKNGLRYPMFHTTALCSPTRAALITGRNHHSNASGVITEMATKTVGWQVLRRYGCHGSHRWVTNRIRMTSNGSCTTPTRITVRRTISWTSFRTS